MWGNWGGASGGYQNGGLEHRVCEGREIGLGSLVRRWLCIDLVTLPLEGNS